MVFSWIFLEISKQILGWYGWIHTVTLTNLKTDTTYFYKCGDQSYYWSQEYNFTTAPILFTDKTYKFAVMGDMGTVNPMGTFYFFFSST